MSTYKLTYFCIKAPQGELPRFVFAYGGIPYENILIHAKDWKQKREEINAPFKTLPMLEVDGVRLCQSKAICRLLAGRCGLTPDNDLDCAKVDMVLDCIEDLAITLYHNIMLDDKENFVKNLLPEKLGCLEAMLVEHGGAWSIGSKVTLVDLAVATYEEYYGELLGRPLDLSSYPRFAQISKKVKELPSIKKWLVDREANGYITLAEHGRLRGYRREL